ncbi:NPCBM-associated, NEW3 domain of alpha-galactosidase [Streptomyces sp. YIM 121038]|uniref:NEW3 domain-containing protein n=1 Tax=Streptomyces sp. YIM 121038 TaxID=2136401 RepID=UPI0011106315|nr:NEW3 domain-containing protein [Streptomyces sp. YIM 121038]QCX74687.1 NPCBM-associated, NEW3 domain of alpha-galactosidase [Streptomyces sp. YIM 121038]
MSIDRRTAVAAGITAGLGLAAASAVSRATTSPQGVPGNGAITVRGESATRTSLPVARDPRASGGAYLALDTADAPPARGGWYATYTVDAPAAGPYRLTAVASVPVEQPHAEQPGSYLRLAVNGTAPLPLAHSQPHWYESPKAWGALSRVTLGEVELCRGANTLTFTVEGPTVLDAYTGYRFLLDEFTLTPVPLALRAVRVRDRAGEPADNLGHYRDERHAALAFELNAAAPEPVGVSYRLLDHSSKEVASGRVRVPAGAAGAVLPLPALPPGAYRVLAALGSAPRATVTGRFARLPERRAVRGPANRFGVNVATYALVPPARLPALASALAAMGVGHVRDGGSWPAAQRAPRGPFAAEPFDTARAAFHDHGLKVVEVVSPPPDWALTRTSVPLPADLRDAYRYTAHLAGRGGRVPADALQLSNEPDVDATASTGDQHAAYVKAAALGIADQPDAPPVVLPGIAQEGLFQELMLRNDVVRYADVWSFHGYPPLDDTDPDPSSAPEEQQELRGRFGAPGREVAMWMTECGAFLPAVPGGDPAYATQRTQARYLVLSAVESLAAGTDRQFWFCGPPCTDDGVSFALFSRDFQPLPAFSAYAALTALLGEANYAGTITELLPRAAGFVFADGAGRTVTVVCAPRPRSVDVPVPDGPTRVYDIMGAARGAPPRSRRGTVRVKAGRDPLYLVTEAPPPRRPRPPAGDGRTRTRPLSPAEHIVLDQRFAAADAAPDKADGDAEPPLGYRLGTTTRMRLAVYNFNPTARTVTLTARPPAGWSVTPRRVAEVRVPAHGRVRVLFTVTAGERVATGADHPLTFEARLGDEPVPPSVSLVQRRPRGGD